MNEGCLTIHFSPKFNISSILHSYCKPS